MHTHELLYWYGQLSWTQLSGLYLFVNFIK